MHEITPKHSFYHVQWLTSINLKMLWGGRGGGGGGGGGGEVMQVASDGICFM